MPIWKWIGGLDCSEIDKGSRTLFWPLCIIPTMRCQNFYLSISLHITNCVNWFSLKSVESMTKHLFITRKAIFIFKFGSNSIEMEWLRLQFLMAGAEGTRSLVQSHRRQRYAFLCHKLPIQSSLVQCPTRPSTRKLDKTGLCIRILCNAKHTVLLKWNFIDETQKTFYSGTRWIAWSDRLIQTDSGGTYFTNFWPADIFFHTFHE